MIRLDAKVGSRQDVDAAKEEGSKPHRFGISVPAEMSAAMQCAHCYFENSNSHDFYLFETNRADID
jgi:hypothetical protein